MSFVTTLALLSCLVCLSSAQRSPYAALGTGPQLLSRFRPQEDGLVNRDNVDGAGSDDDTTDLPEELQGTLEDDATVHRVSLWPENRQPFWFKNRQVMKEQRVRPVNGANFQDTGASQPWFFNPSSRPVRGNLGQDLRENFQGIRNNLPSNGNWNWRDVRPANSGMRFDLNRPSSS